MHLEPSCIVSNRPIECIWHIIGPSSHLAPRPKNKNLLSSLYPPITSPILPPFQPLTAPPHLLIP